MTNDQAKILQATKEIVVKFIEVGRVSPTQFEEVFRSVHRVVTSCAGDDTAAG